MKGCRTQNVNKREKNTLPMYLIRYGLDISFAEYLANLNHF